MLCKSCTQVCVFTEKRKFHGGFTCVSVRHWQKLAYLRQQLQAISAHWPSYYIFNCLPPISLYTCTALAEPPYLLNECDLYYLWKTIFLPVDVKSHLKSCLYFTLEISNSIDFNNPYFIFEIFRKFQPRTQQVMLEQKVLP